MNICEEEKLEAATAHYENKLKWRAFHRLQLYNIHRKLFKLELDLVDNFYKRKLKANALNAFKSNVQEMRMIRSLCDAVKLTKFLKVSDFLSYTRSFEMGEGMRVAERDKKMIFAINFNRVRMMRKYFNLWRKCCNT